MLCYKIKKYILLVLFISGLGNACCAEGNLPYIDQKFIHFGFLLGFNTMDFSVTPTTSNDIARVSALRPGFSVGIIGDLRLNRYLNLRVTPTLHFGERQLNYSFNNTTTHRDSLGSVSISSIPICLPIYLKYSAERKGNFRPYLLLGGGVSYDLGRNSNSENPVLLKPLDFYTEFGVGCDIYFSFFKLAPELKYSIGANNILVPGNQRKGLSDANKKYSNVLSSLGSRMLTLVFNFE